MGNQYDFGGSAKPLSIVIASAIVLIVSIISNKLLARKVNKIGKISNKDILNKIYKKESDAFSSLQTYAKNDTNPIYDKKWKQNLMMKTENIIQ